MCDEKGLHYEVYSSSSSGWSCISWGIVSTYSPHIQ
jgi:hypothetical protein